eukprot:gene20843-22886_t
MALMKDSLWSLIDGTETVPLQTEAERHAKYVTKKNRALGTVVLLIELCLLYLLGDLQDPVVVWNKLATQFQKKTWANKLALRRKLYSLRLKESQSVQQHIKEMTEVSEELSILGDPIEEEDCVVHLLASLPSSFYVWVTALEASEDVPKIEMVTKPLLREQMKQKEKGACGGAAHDVKALTSKQPPRKKGPICNHCGKVGHIKRNCYDLQRKKEEVSYKSKQQKAYSTVERHQFSEQDSDSDVVALVVHEKALSSADKNHSNTERMRCAKHLVIKGNTEGDLELTLFTNLLDMMLSFVDGLENLLHKGSDEDPTMLFYGLEDLDILNVLNDVHVFALHKVFIPMINNCLKEFCEQMNHRPLSTERNRSLLQLFTGGILSNMHLGSVAIDSVLNPEVLESYGVDPNSFAP